MQKKILTIVICLLLFSGSLVVTVSAAEIQQQTDPIEIVIKVKPGVELSNNITSTVITGYPSIDQLNMKYGVTHLQPVFESVINHSKNPALVQSIGLNRIYQAIIEKNVNLPEVITAFSQNPLIEEADIAGVGYGCIFPNDPSFNKQWGFHNTGQEGGTVDADIDAPEAWDLQMGNGNIVVAIIDSGIDYNHQDLATRIWINRIEDINGNLQVDPSDFNGIDDDGNGFVDDLRGWNFVSNNNNPLDDHTSSHGTHCAGIAGANTFNNVGVAGALWSCQLMPVKSMKWDNSIQWSHAGPGIVYAADNGAQIISMSFSGGSDNITLKNACDYAYASGCILVAAMGNHGTSIPKIPAKYESVIAVGATDHDDNRWSSSGYGNHIDVVAPGVDVYSTLRNNQYGYMTGTSMAAPMVAGIVGLLLAEYPTLTNDNVRTALIYSSEDQVGNPIQDTPGFDKFYGYGRVNAYNALVGPPTPPEKPVGEIRGKPGVTYTYSTCSYDPFGDDLAFGWDWNGDDIVDEWDDNSGSYYNSGAVVSVEHSWSTQGTYTVQVKAKDVHGLESGWSEPLEISMPKILVFLRFPFFQRLLERFCDMIQLLDLL